MRGVSLGPGALNARKSRDGQPRAAVVLIGFMGAGKTTVGRELAQRLGWTFEDLDQWIEKLERRRIHQIFRDSGEAEFRRIEHATLKNRMAERSRRRKIIALGGGTFVQPENAHLLAAAKVPTVFLDANVEELWERCCEKAGKEVLTRPLLGSIDSFRELHEKRRPFYMRASFRVETGARAVEDIVTELIEILDLPRAASSKAKKASKKQLRRKQA